MTSILKTMAAPPVTGRILTGQKEAVPPVRRKHPEDADPVEITIAVAAVPVVEADVRAVVADAGNSTF